MGRQYAFPDGVWEAVVSVVREVEAPETGLGEREGAVGKDGYESCATFEHCGGVTSRRGHVEWGKSRYA